MTEHMFLLAPLMGAARAATGSTAVVCNDFFLVSEGGRECGRTIFLKCSARQ